MSINNKQLQNWQKVRLADFVEIKGGKRLPKGKLLVKVATEHPYIRVTDIENNLIKEDQLEFVPDDVYPSISNYTVASGDLLISIVGTIGLVAKIRKNLDGANLTENCVKVTKTDYRLNEIFLFYYLISKFGQNEIKKNTVGAVQKKLPLYGIKNIEVFLPDLYEQKRIASVLSTIDDKIEINNKINETLEKMAQAIFNEWFVKFRFPRYEKVKMVDSELGKIPERWEVKKIEDVIDIRSGFSFKSKDFVDSGKYNLVTIKNVHDGEFVTEGPSRLETLPHNMPEHCLLKTGDMLLSLTGNVGRVCLLYGDGYLLNQRVAKLVPKDQSFYGFGYLLFRSASFKLQLEALSGGSAQQNLSPVETGKLKIVLPTDKIMQEFASIANKIIDQIVKNKLENQKLASLRDYLLPKLMSGEIRV